MKAAIDSEVDAIIYMNGDLNDMVSNTFKEYCRQKRVFIHIDLLKGLSSDKESLQFIQRYVRPYGIVSTKSNIIKSAKKEGLVTIQRVFLIDTKSYNTSIEAISHNDPDCVEVMPAIAPSIVKSYKQQLPSISIILGGLVSEESHISEAFKQGADAVSLSKTSLWNYRPAMKK
ncbi:glycerol-3-phosphate responsive antiterminator [Cohnella cellulosilytica]